MNQQGMHYRSSRSKASIGRMAGAIVALGGLSGLILAEGTAGAATSVTVATTKNGKLGTILVSGKPLYTLKASKTACTTTCLKVWPALTLPAGVTAAKAGKGVSAAKLGTVMTSNGTLQVTYAGKPLYRFSGDTGTAKVHGNVTDSWGKWTAVVTAKSANSTSSGGSGGGSTAGSGGSSF